MSHARWVLLSLIALSDPLLARAAAPSPADVATAKALFQRGARLYAAGKYQDALVAFEASHRLSQRPDLLFNLGQTALRLERREAARRYLLRYLEARPDAADAAEVRAQIKDLEAAPAPQPAVQPVVPGRPASDRRPPVPALVLVGAGAGLLGLGIGLSAGAASTAREVNGSMYFDAALDQRGRALDAAGISLNVIGALTLGAGGAWLGVWYWQRTRSN